MAATSLQCNNCFINAEKTKQKKLLYCGVHNCRIQCKLLCLTCGQASHANKKAFDHEFGGNSIEMQSQYAKTIMKYNTQTSSANNATKKTLTLGAFATVGAIQVGMLEAIKEFGLKEGVKQFTGKAWNLTKYGKGVAGGIQVALCVWECGCEIQRYRNGLITGKELTKLITRSIAANSAAWGGAVTGAAVGGSIGGLPGAAIGTVVGGVVGDLGTRFVFNKFMMDDDEEAKNQEKEINIALQTFGFIGCTMKNVFSEEEFNGKEVQKEYYRLALKYHPDKRHGSPEKFEEILKNYNILLGVLQKKEGN